MLKAKLFVMGLALMLVAAQARPALARQKGVATGDWSTVQAIPSGEKIVVRTKDGKRFEGTFDSATDLIIALKRDGKSTAVERERVRRVSRKGGKSRKNGALWGAAIGGGSGLAVGGGLYQGSESDFVGAIIPVTTILGAGIGAAIGALLGKGKKDVTIYEAP